MNWAHVHLLLNHVPVIGAAFGLALLAYGTWRRDAGVTKAALSVFVVVAMAAAAVFLTGEPAKELLEGTRGIPERLIERHENVALPALIAVTLVGAASLVALIIARWTALAAAWTRAALVLSVIAFGLLAWTAALGGQIRHEEIRSGAVTGAGHEADEHEGH